MYYDYESCIMLTLPSVKHLADDRFKYVENLYCFYLHIYTIIIIIIIITIIIIIIGMLYFQFDLYLFIYLYGNKFHLYNYE